MVKGGWKKKKLGRCQLCETAFSGMLYRMHLMLRSKLKVSRYSPVPVKVQRASLQSIRTVKNRGRVTGEKARRQIDGEITGDHSSLLVEWMDTGEP